jgi:hypothetical protein
MTASKPPFAPYENEADVVEIGGLTLENRVDRITIGGDVDLTADRRGLQQAKLLQELLTRVVAALEAKELPDQLPPPAVKKVDNPFA